MAPRPSAPPALPSPSLSVFSASANSASIGGAAAAREAGPCCLGGTASASSAGNSDSCGGAGGPRRPAEDPAIHWAACCR